MPSSLPQAVAEFKRRRDRARTTGVLAGSTALVAAVFWTPWALLVLGGVVLAVLSATRSPPDEVVELPSKLHAADERVRVLTRQIERERATYPVFAQIDRFEALYDSLGKFDQIRVQKLRAFEQQKRARQLRRHLDLFEVDKSGLKGFGRGLFATLVSHGIETADDVLEHRLQGIPGFGPKRIAALLEWKRAHEVSFRFNPSDPTDRVEQARLERDLTIEHNRDLAQLARLGDQIRAAAPPIVARMSAMNVELHRAHEELATFSAAARALGMVS
jgi:hypothetical protein